MGDKPRTLKEEIWQWRDAAIDSKELPSSTAWIVAVLSTKMKPYLPWIVNIEQLAKWAKLSRRAATVHLRKAVEAGFLAQVEKTNIEGRPGRLHAQKEYAPKIPGVPDGWDYGVQYREGAELPPLKNDIPKTDNQVEVDMRTPSTETRRYFTGNNGNVYELYSNTDYITTEKLLSGDRSNLNEGMIERYEQNRWYRSGGDKMQPKKEKEQKEPVPEVSRGFVDITASAAWQDVIKPALRMKHGESTYNSWIRPLTLLIAEVNAEKVTFVVSTRFIWDWIMAHYMDDLREMWGAEGRGEVEIIIGSLRKEKAV